MVNYYELSALKCIKVHITNMVSIQKVTSENAWLKANILIKVSIEMRIEFLRM